MKGIEHQYHILFPLQYDNVAVMLLIAVCAVYCTVLYIA